MKIFKLSNECALRLAFICAISTHLIAELIRRFFYFSNVIYLVADIILIVFTALVIRGNSLRFDRNLAAMLFAYVLWGTASLLYSGANAELLAVGIRPLMLACATYIIAANYFYSSEDASHFFVVILSCWVAAILGVATLQLASGVNASINALPDGINAEFGGRGDYTGNGGGIAWLFRPTSIFMHTGRLGQYSFFLGLALILPVLLKRHVPKLHWAGAILAGLLVLVSGQRAAGVFLVSSCALTVFLFASKKVLFRSVVSSFAIVLFFLIISAELRDVVVSRFASGFTDGFDRASSMTKYWDVSFFRYPLFGNGLGFFSFGGSSFGGQIYYEYMRLFGGGGENSWLRIQGETGIPGLLMFVFMVALIVVKSYKRACVASISDRIIHLTTSLFALFSAFWAFTHDVYGNYLYLMPMFLLFGASSGLAKRNLTNVVIIRQSVIDAPLSLNVAEDRRINSSVDR